MGTSTQAPAAVTEEAALYLESAIRLNYETLMPDEENEAAALADWANAGYGLSRPKTCEAIATALAAVRILLSRDLSTEAREKLEHDREVLELRGTHLAHKGVRRRLEAMAGDEYAEQWEVENKIDRAKAETHRRFSRTQSPDVQFELLGHKMALDRLELDVRAW